MPDEQTPAPASPKPAAPSAEIVPCPLGLCQQNMLSLPDGFCRRCGYEPR